MSKDSAYFIDNIIGALDNGMRVLFADPQPKRRSPTVTDRALNQQPDQIVDDSESRQRSVALMRVNHVGEVCAQALYQGQAITSRSENVKRKMRVAAEEEIDHLQWCAERIAELDGKTSIFNPLWYMGSFALGVSAGVAGDKWSLGFLAETERQVVDHLRSHLQRLPSNDHRSRAIVEQMVIDETQHAEMAEDSGAAELPQWVKSAMRATAKVMTSISEKA